MKYATCEVTCLVFNLPVYYSKYQCGLCGGDISRQKAELMNWTEVMNWDRGQLTFSGSSQVISTEDRQTWWLKLAHVQIDWQVSEFGDRVWSRGCSYAGVLGACRGDTHSYTDTHTKMHVHTLKASKERPRRSWQINTEAAEDKISQDP